MKLLLILSILFTFSLTAFADTDQSSTDSESQASQEPQATSEVTAPQDQCPPSERVPGKPTQTTPQDSDQGGQASATES